jgi:hypothetical protein
MLGHLQNIQPAGGPRLAELLQHMLRLIHRRSVILFFSDLLEDADGIRESFQQLRFLGHECLVFQVLDRDELEFPFEQSSVFRDLETQERRTVDPNAARDRYLKRFESFLKEYHDLFQSLEIPHCVLRTDQEPWEALSLFLHERQRLM